MPGTAHRQPFHAEAYLQARLTDPEQGNSYEGLRRLELDLSGAPAPRDSWLAQILYKDNNHSGTDNHVWVQDMWARRRFHGGSLTVGQLKPPMGLERLTSDYALATIDRTIITDSLVPDAHLGRSFARDIGVQWEQGDATRGNVFQIGLFSGNGTFQQRVYGNGPLGAVRATRRVPLPIGGAANWFQVGGSFAGRRDSRSDFSKALAGTKTLGMDRFRGSDLRWGAEAALNLGAARAQAEYMSARFSGWGNSPHLHSTGWYARLIYGLTPRWEGTLTYQDLDPNTAARDKNDLRWTTLGVNYRIRGRDRVQVNYTVEREAVNVPGNNVLQVQYQRYLF